MMHTDHRFADTIEAAVSAMERRTDAEIIVVAAARSAPWTHIPERLATLMSLLLLITLLAVPWTFHPASAVVELSANWLLVRWVANRPWALRRLLPRATAAAVVRQAAEAEFVREAVHATPNRTGILIYVSALEGRVEVLPDLGIQGLVPPGELAGPIATLKHDDLDHFLVGLNALADVLARHMPHHGDSDATDLPNAPRIRA